jgi:hypothetical protein
MTKNKTLQPITIRYQEDKTELAKNKKVKMVGRQMRLETEKFTDTHEIKKMLKENGEGSESILYIKPQNCQT